MANLTGTISARSQNKQFGERFGVEVVIRNQTGPQASLIFVSATFSVYDSATPANAIINAATVMMIQTYSNGSIQLRYMVATGPAQTITLPGTYRYVFAVKTSDGEVTNFEQVALLNTLP